MRIILMLIKKEFLQVFRSPLLMSILIVAPMVQFILFPFTADYEIKVLDIAFIDNDNSTLSRQLIEEFSSSIHFRSKGMIDSKSYADQLMKADKIDFLVEIPQDFEKSINAVATANGGTLELAEDPVNITGGFLLKYGNIEINSSIDAICEDRKEELVDRVNNVLFGTV